jgi:hypothetical protein
VSAEGAMSSEYFTLVVTNRGPSCTMNARPTLYYTRPGGTVARLPIARVNPGTKSGSLRVPHGRAIDLVVRTPDGYGGYAPTAPQCAHPATYQGISVAIGSGRLPVPHFQLDVKCEGVTLWQAWTLSS